MIGLELSLHLGIALGTNWIFVTCFLKNWQATWKLKGSRTSSPKYMFHASMSDSSLTSTVKILKIVLFFSSFFKYIRVPPEGYNTILQRYCQQHINQCSCLLQEITKITNSSNISTLSKLQFLNATVEWTDVNYSNLSSTSSTCSCIQVCVVETHTPIHTKHTFQCVYQFQSCWGINMWGFMTAEALR